MSINLNVKKMYGVDGHDFLYGIDALKHAHHEVIFGTGNQASFKIAMIWAILVILSPIIFSKTNYQSNDLSYAQFRGINRLIYCRAEINNLGHSLDIPYVQKGPKFGTREYGFKLFDFPSRQTFGLRSRNYNHDVLDTINRPYFQF